MRKSSIAAGVLTAILLSLAIGAVDFDRASKRLSFTTPVLASADSSSDEIESAAVEPRQAVSAVAKSATIHGKPLYFVPQDSDGTGTVLVFVNTTQESATVPIIGFAEDGTQNFSATVDLGTNRVVRAISDSLAASPPPSWSNTQIVNFTDFVAYAAVYPPKGVKVDGYVVFNPGTGTIDPRADQGAIPLRFMQ